MFCVLYILNDKYNPYVDNFMQIDISASIVLYKTKENYLEKIIQDFFDTDMHVCLLLIDNSPTDDLKILSAIDKRIEYIWLQENKGFGKAHNIAINKMLGKSKYHVILNPDIEFDKEVLPALYTFMNQNPDVGNVIPKVYYKTGEVQPLCKLLPTPLTLFSRRFARYSFFTKKLNHRYELENFRYNAVMKVPNMSGCFMFIRNTVLQQTGGFDERFFLYLEDVDLNRRIGRIAKTVVYPYVHIMHHFRKGSYQEPELLKHHIRSAIHYFNKWGWFLDWERAHINNKTIKRIKELNNSKK